MQEILYFGVEESAQSMHRLVAPINSADIVQL